MLNVINAVCSVVAKAYPSMPVYINNQPEGFVRPSFFVNFINDSTDTLDHFTDIIEANVQVVYFAPLDNYKTIDTEDILTVYANMKKIYSTGYIKDGSTVVKINKVTGAPRDGGINLTLNLTVTTDKDLPAETTDLIQNIILNKEVNNNG